MGVVEELRSHGLDITDDTATVTVQGVTQRVTIDTSPSAGVGLLIEGPVDGWAGNTPPVDAALVAGGDTEVDVTSGTARLTRHLATTDVAAVYDAVFELAKVGARIGLRLADAAATAARQARPRRRASPSRAASHWPARRSPRRRWVPRNPPQPRRPRPRPGRRGLRAIPWFRRRPMNRRSRSLRPSPPRASSGSTSTPSSSSCRAARAVRPSADCGRVSGTAPSREEAGWVKATDEYGRVGWVRASAAHRHQG